MPSNPTPIYAHASTRRHPVNLHLDLPPHSPPQQGPPAQIQAVQPPARPPSRSEFLLRETLLKDGEGREKERRRRLSLSGNEGQPSVRHERRSSSGTNDMPTPRQRRLSLNRSVTDGDLNLHPRSKSPLPLPPSLPLTPHEQILRARLERVLSASSMHSQSLQTDTYEEMRMPQYLPTPVSAGGASPVQKTGDFFASENNRSTSRTRSRTEPVPTPLSPPTPSSSHPRRPSLSYHGGHSTVASSRSPPSPMAPKKKFTLGLETVPSMSDLRGRGRSRRDSGMEMVTPPPTPPPAAFHLNLTFTPIRPPHHPSSPKANSFDAHTASAHCRQLPGYVSFASVDGLGEPESSEVESEVEEIRRRDRNKGRWLGIF
uniref:Uncharacterized protein n=1 Tax=Moniliophthora roreri TaxID=221103 RepID=A0A0W0F220_MONRR